MSAGTKQISLSVLLALFIAGNTSAGTPESCNEAGGGPPLPLPVAMAVGRAVGYLAGWGLDSHHDVIITIP